MHNWLTRTYVASTWPPKAPSDAWKLLPWAPWEERAEEDHQVGVEEVLVSVEEQEQREAEEPTRG